MHGILLVCFAIAVDFLVGFAGPFCLPRTAFAGWGFVVTSSSSYVLATVCRAGPRVLIAFELFGIKLLYPTHGFFPAAP